MPTDAASYGYELTVDEKDRFVYRKDEVTGIGSDTSVLEGTRDPQTGGWDVRFYKDSAGYGAVADGIVVGGSMGKDGAKEAAIDAMREEAAGENIGHSPDHEFSFGGGL